MVAPRRGATTRRVRRCATPPGSDGITGSSFPGSSTPGYRVCDASGVAYPDCRLPAARTIRGLPTIGNTKRGQARALPRVRRNFRRLPELGSRRRRLQWSWASSGPKEKKHEPTRNGNRRACSGARHSGRSPQPDQVRSARPWKAEGRRLDSGGFCQVHDEDRSHEVHEHNLFVAEDGR